MKYTSAMKKEDILKVIVEEFYATKKETEEAQEEGWKTRIDRADGRYIALMNIMQKIKIHEHE